ncbi:hypothetical protein K5E_11300 [Enterococcus thailandicus]|uniref:hypothetical protein n=1 Tax=Enterococcus thailandicus TaxID=417368 RepID=UPI00244D97F8|nr:hypothetical protein [Enterococcus thailandicus]GMC02572.1 hypothetical protein K4E_00820 [Enterococcus thailandicus]GMC08991.1 hypothetical protein K5E_11300 [Enterococcus thailandicus]
MDMNDVKIQETMQDWFIYFDQNIADFKLRHKDDELKNYTFKEVKQIGGEEDGEEK